MPKKKLRLVWEFALLRIIGLGIATIYTAPHYPLVAVVAAAGWLYLTYRFVRYV